jgi:two-component system, OmpR family, copper resistance phosphate regulon response regulator CusR
LFGPNTSKPELLDDESVIQRGRGLRENAAPPIPLNTGHRAAKPPQAMRILVVEDDPKLADYLHKALGENGYVVDVARDGIEGRRLAVHGDYALVVLDIMLPGVDGFGVLKALREERPLQRVPVLMLTARERVEDRVRGLESGADDYLVKPFAFSELLARVGALLRRGAAPAVAAGGTTQLRIADLEVDLVSRKAQRGGERLHLTAKEFSLLTLLMRRQGQILSRSTLAEQVWDMNFDSDTNVVEVAVRRLRAKIDDPFKGKLLHNVRGMGYVLEQRS